MSAMDRVSEVATIRDTAGTNGRDVIATQIERSHPDEGHWLVRGMEADGQEPSGDTAGGRLTTSSQKEEANPIESDTPLADKFMRDYGEFYVTRRREAYSREVGKVVSAAVTRMNQLGEAIHALNKRYLDIMANRARTAIPLPLTQAGAVDLNQLEGELFSAKVLAENAALIERIVHSDTNPSSSVLTEMFIIAAGALALVGVDLQEIEAELGDDATPRDVQKAVIKEYLS